MNIENHPDKAAINQLIRSLYNEGTAKGAAVLVGAGISRSALVLENTPLPPLWNDLANGMAKELYGDASKLSRDTSPTQLAEEYRAELGTAALVDFLKRQINDVAWEPSNVHRQILELPWSDVLTTNYDTLLERAALETDRRYSTVLSENDLAHASGSRIIKLHGTIQNMHDVIISEEDYRQYPNKHAAFLNTARQVLLENELCLIGFSGEDPNFLNWTGWVRDILKSGARRIFLVGLLKLSPSKRRFLEKQNIVPIDLTHLFNEGEEYDHQTAYEVFLSYLLDNQPHPSDEWSILDSNEYSPKDAEEQRKLRGDGVLAKPHLLAAMKTWENERKTYPGWLIAPEAERWDVSRSSFDFMLSSKSLSALTYSEKISFLEELSWRYSRMLLPLPKYALEEIDNIIIEKDGYSQFSQFARTDLFQTLLHSIYQYRGRSGLLEFLERSEHNNLDASLSVIAEYYRCIAAIRALDYDYVSENISKLEKFNSDPIWLLRISALLLWLGREDEAVTHVLSSVELLKKMRRTDPTSMWVQSRLVWALWIKSRLKWGHENINDERAALRSFTVIRGCDPESMLGSFRSSFVDALDKNRREKAISVTFDAGSYIDHSYSSTSDSATLENERYAFTRMCEIIGIPQRASYIDFSSSISQKSCELSAEKDLVWYTALLHTYPKYDGAIMNQFFGRIAVAQMELELAEKLANCVKAVISYWRSQRLGKNGKKNTFAVERLRMFIEVLARLSIRMSSNDAILDFNLANDLATDERLKHWWLYAHIGNLMKNSFSAVQPKERYKLSQDLLEFPLISELVIPNEMSWPNIAQLCYQNIDYRGEKEVLRRRIGAFIAAVIEGGSGREEAVLRLTYLNEAGLLNQNEKRKFGSALWNNLEAAGAVLPKKINLYPHVLIILPSPKSVSTRDVIYKEYYLSGSQKSLPVWDHAYAISLAARDKRVNLFPKPSHAKRMFETICKWRPKKHSKTNSFIDFHRAERIQGNRSMGRVLSDAVLPVLNKKLITKNNALNVIDLIDQAELTTALPALVYFVDNQKVLPEIVRQLRRAITSPDHHVIADGTEAVVRWLGLIDAGTVKEKLPQKLIAGVLKALFRTPDIGLSSLLHCARTLVEHNCLDSESITELAELLDELHNFLDYSNIAADQPRAIGTPWARVECIKLSDTLKLKGRKEKALTEWLEMAEHDPLPEVRNVTPYLVAQK